MRKILVTYFPTSLLLVILAIALLTFGGCGGDSGGGSLAGGGGDGGGGVIPAAATLTGLSINGPSSMEANSTATYTATASWSDNSTSTVTPTWGVNSYVAEISSSGVLSCHQSVVYDEPASITATYSAGGITKTATLNVTITNKTISATLTGLSINGPSSMSEYGTATYTATASWSDNSTSTVTPTWSVNSQFAGISTGGVLYCQGGIASDQTVAVSATYSAGGNTITAAKDVTITHVPSIPFTAQELSGRAFFYESELNILNADFSLVQYSTYGYPRGDPSYYVTGTWSNLPNCLDLNFRLFDRGPYTVQRIADSSTAMEVAIYQEPWLPYVVTWEKTVPVDPAKLPGTYKQSVEGYTWVFNADGTGSVSIFGGINFTWSVDSAGVLKMPSATGYTAVFYARASSQSTATSYTNLKVGFAEHNTSTGNFYKYFGGYELTRQ